MTIEASNYRKDGTIKKSTPVDTKVGSAERLSRGHAIVGNTPNMIPEGDNNDNDFIPMIAPYPLLSS